MAKQYDALTVQGQARRLRCLVIEALKQNDIFAYQ
jgi:hypothetical protein